MILEHYGIEQFKQELRQIVGQHLDLTKYKLIIFGSRVTGTATEASDIDVGIWGPEAVPSLVMAKIKEAVQEWPILYKIDIVDLATVSDKFKGVALQNYEQV